MCYGVNDILCNISSEQIKSDLYIIVDELQKSGIKVILQTVPPFNFKGEQRSKWLEVNEYILDVLKNKADMIFDVVPFLAESAECPYNAKYGGHPDANGCKIWAKELYPKLKMLLDE